MKRHLKGKLYSCAGETIAETLVALLISALALTMLAGAIGTANRIITRSETQMQAYYQANNALATPGSNAKKAKKVTTGTAAVSVDKTIVNETGGFSVSYTRNDVFGGKPVVAYAKAKEGE